MTPWTEGFLLLLALKGCNTIRGFPTTMIATTAPRDSGRYARLVTALQWPMAILALAVIPALLLDEGASPTLHLLSLSLNWIIWTCFLGEFLALMALAPDRSQFVRQSWFNVLIILITPPFAFVPPAWQGLRAVRALRVVRLLRAFGLLTFGLKKSRSLLQHRRLQYVLLTTVGIVALGAIGIFVLEHNTNESIGSVGDALWWAVSTTTTVGYGDIYPKTGEGRIIAVVLMLTGIGVIGTFTATIASFFFTEEKNSDFEHLHRRLDDIEGKLAEVLKDRRERSS